MVLTVAAQGVRVPGQRGGDALAYVLSVGLTLPYAVHRRRPMLALGIVTASLLVVLVFHFAAFPGLSVFVLLFGIALHCARRRRRWSRSS